MKLSVALGVLAAALALGGAGCGSDGDSSGEPAQAAGAPIPGRGLSVEEALSTTADGPLAVVGYLIERDGEFRLCSAILESDPPQCGEPSLEVRGAVDLDEIGAHVSLLGDVEDGVLTVSETTQS